MIVKNESHIICETFDNLLKYIPFDYWVISDTGSTDNTKELITEYFKNKKIDGELVEHEWRDFGYNRSKALECAYNKSDYLLIFDADDKLVGDFKIPITLNHDMYHFRFGKGFTYLRPLLINNRKNWEFKGVLHEYLSCKDSIGNPVTIDGNYYVESGRLGFRSKNPKKYQDDATVLEAAFEKEKNGGDESLASRYAFYCAQSYKDCQNSDKAIEWYKKCLTLNNWLQEKYYSAFMIGSLLKKKETDDESLKYFFKTVEYDVERIEGVVAAMEILLKKGDHLLVNCLYHRFKNYHTLSQINKLFVFQELYKDKIEYLNSISASYVNDKESGYICCKRIITNSKLADAELVQTVKNLNFYKEQMENDCNADIVSLFENVDKIIFKNKIFDEKVSTTWKTLYNKRKEILKSSKKIKSSKKNFIKIVNLVRREDRKENIMKELKKGGVEKDKFDFIEAVDGKTLEPTFHLKKLFRNNDFNYRKGVIGCALSHLKIWENLLTDPFNEYYIVLEDDITISNKFHSYIDKMNSVFLDKDVVFLGYHMQKEMRQKFSFIYNDINEPLKHANLAKKLFFGGTFSYTINKMGAKKLLDSAEKNGIGRAIDFFMIDTDGLECFESRPQLVFSEWLEDNIQRDSDIQNDGECLSFPDIENEYIFLKGIDQIGNDIFSSKNRDIHHLMDIAYKKPECIAFNTFGYFKNKIEVLQPVTWFSDKDGIFIRKDAYNAFLLDKEKSSEEKNG